MEKMRKNYKDVPCTPSTHFAKPLHPRSLAPLLPFIAERYLFGLLPWKVPFLSGS
jgi:hypothetical protein